MAKEFPDPKSMMQHETGWRDMGKKNLQSIIEWS